MARIGGLGKALDRLGRRPDAEMLITFCPVTALRTPLRLRRLGRLSAGEIVLPRNIRVSPPVAGCRVRESSKRTARR